MLASIVEGYDALIMGSVILGIALSFILLVAYMVIGVQDGMRNLFSYQRRRR